MQEVDIVVVVVVVDRPFYGDGQFTPSSPRGRFDAVHCGFTPLTVQLRHLALKQSISKHHEPVEVVEVRYSDRPDLLLFYVFGIMVPVMPQGNSHFRSVTIVSEGKANEQKKNLGSK